ncbi:L-seryl-tRNA(Sec) kinase-like isoform X2 [Ostrea edulis]|nr:L-seryl-tRNA(Sec) kinase-like isoform X2 [Ostrea edulis]XP_056006452.1 L-seryl-tRNA(Sec) kinase-like isoform X2 [Ostrea edulis]XP_056006453.1 L-seryl-tRNA(Sec) kinase-like isoform X2 [Ostrea edulis]XP_056006454.1 L-seryl-tRNA(Sec) kinase-like isoform X2 [Ostrea edulis]XP_056006455.1 L-seryl-tRNA(Sec) kinase-like isoform X2 [Ostrea edulis]
MLDVCVVVLCGVPGSGKSTFANYLIKNQKGDNCDGQGVQKRRDDASSIHWLLVSYDDIIPSDVERNIIEREVPNAWKSHREKVQNAVESLIQTLKPSSEMTEPITNDNSDCHSKSFGEFLWEMRGREDGSVVIVIDDNMYYTSMRYKFYQLTRKYRVGYCQVHTECDTDVSLVRNRQRTSRQVPDDIILNMAARFEAPNPEHNSWEKYSITVNTTVSPEVLEDSVMQTMEVISRALSDPSKPITDDVDQTSREVDRKICSENIIHQADILMRKLIAEYMSQASKQSTDKSHMKALSASLGLCKSDILQNMKKGELYFGSPEELASKLRDVFQEKMAEGSYG